MAPHRSSSWQSGMLVLALLGCGSDAIDGAGPPPVDPPPQAVGLPALSVGPGVILTVRSSDDLQPMPARVLVYPQDPRVKLDFKADANRMSSLSPGVYGVPEGVMLPYGNGLLPLPPGAYWMRFLQGMEYESLVLDVRVPKGQVVPVDAVLQHTVHFPEPGWIGSDQHIHSRISADSKVPTNHRVISEVCSGVSVLVPTEHVLHNDFAPEIADLGLSKYAVSIPGSEYGFDLGHIGVFPVEFDPRAPLYGAPDWERWPWGGVDAPTFFPMIHQMPGQPLVIVNHPRLPPDLGYFYNLRWQPGQRLPSEGMFDGLEVLNGYENTPSRIVTVLRDWFYLLNRSQRVTGVGNSDTHRIDWLRAGYPRTFLRLPTEEPERILPDDVRTAMLAMLAVATNGPLVHIKVDGHSMGEVVPVVGGRVRVEVWADAPGWVDLSRVLLYQNGVQVAELPIGLRHHPALQTSVVLKVPAEGWIVAVAVGNEPLSSDIIGAVGDGKVQPFAFTNPVWLDLDGDTKIRPSSVVPPMPAPFGPGVMAAALAEQAAPRILEAPLHAPLDCEPSEWPRWLR